MPAWQPYSRTAKLSSGVGRRDSKIRTWMPLAAHTSADYAPANWQIELSELLRVIQFYNTGSFHCDVLGEDGFAPGSGDTTCAPHDTDYDPQNWIISLSELLRLIQFYNSGGYHACPEGEDGYCAGL